MKANNMVSMGPSHIGTSQHNM